LEQFIQNHVFPLLLEDFTNGLRNPVKQPAIGNLHKINICSL